MSGGSRKKKRHRRIRPYSGRSSASCVTVRDLSTQRAFHAHAKNDNEELAAAYDDVSEDCAYLEERLKKERLAFSTVILILALVITVSFLKYMFKCGDGLCVIISFFFLMLFAVLCNVFDCLGIIDVIQKLFSCFRKK